MSSGSRRAAAGNELPFPDQLRAVVDEVVPEEVHTLAIQEFLQSNVEDQSTVNAAGMRARQRFIDFYAEACAGRPEISSDAIEEVANIMILRVVELFKTAALISMGGFGPDVPLDAPLVRH